MEADLLANWLSNFYLTYTSLTCFFESGITSICIYCNGVRFDCHL